MTTDVPENAVLIMILSTMILSSHSADLRAGLDQTR